MLVKQAPPLSFEAQCDSTVRHAASVKAADRLDVLSCLEKPGAEIFQIPGHRVITAYEPPSKPTSRVNLMAIFLVANATDGV